MKDIKTQYSVIRGLEVIGEVTKKIPKKIREENKDTPWKDIAGMRDKLIHAYFEVNQERVWRVAIFELPKLKTTITKIKKEHQQKSDN